MRPRSTAVVLVLCGLLAASAAMGQVVMRHGDGEENDIVFLREIGVIAGAEPGSDEVRILMLMPDVEREVHLQKGDLLLMINGERVRDMAAVREAYAAAAVGDTVKVGFRRGDERFLASFEKKDQEQMAMSHGGGTMMMVGGPDGGDFDDVEVLHDFSVLLGEMDGEILVAAGLPIGEPALEKNDVVVSINGQEVATLEDFRGIYESVPVGDEVAITVRRGDDEASATRAKSEEQGRVRIRRGP
jgi:PDZ domain